jgi:hypothetical protein
MLTSPASRSVSCRPAWRAEVYWLEGKPGEAAREAELADDGSARCDAWDRGTVAVWLQRLGSARAPRDDLAEPRRRQINGDWARAAELWAEIGCPYEVAMAQLDVRIRSGSPSASVRFST